MLRRPPRSTLFPYPPLCRSAELPTDVVVRNLGVGGSTAAAARGLQLPAALAARPDIALCWLAVNDFAGGRSEEHTSELHSRQYLVCRLLLEKKLTAARAADA